jgi:predicted RNA methylase
MSKVVLKNTQTKAVVKVVSENTTDITATDLSYTVKVESGDPAFGGVASKGLADRVQIPTRLEICRVIYSQDDTHYVELKRGSDTVMVLGGSGDIDFEGQVCEHESSSTPITVAASASGHKYTVYVFINKIGVA